MTIPHFRFHCEISTINLTAFVKDFFYFLEKEQGHLVNMRIAENANTVQ